MRCLQVVGWVIVGLLIGLLTGDSLRAISSQPKSSSRLIRLMNANLMTDSSAYFIKDTKTGACWLTVRSRDDVSAALAPAPRESCEP
jgi:hypothetical protein